VGHNGRVYVAGKLQGYPDQFHNDYYLFAFFYFDGSVIWKKQLTFVEETPQNPIWVGAPAVGPNGVIYITVNGKLYAFNPDSSEKWQYQVEAEVRLSSVAVAFDGTIYVGTRNQLLALTPDGKYKWSFTDPNNVPYYMSSPVIGPDGTVYVTRGDTLYAVNQNGSRKWQYSKDTFFWMPVIGHGGTVYVSGRYKDPPGGPYLGRLDALSPDGPDGNNNPKWTQFLVGSPNSPVIGPSGDLYLGTIVGSCQSGGACQGYFYAITSDGAVRWVVPLDKAVVSMAAVADFDRVIFSVDGAAQGDAELYVLAGGTGEILAQYNILMASTAPIIDIWGGAGYGHIYISANGKVWAIRDFTRRPGEKSAPAFSPWPLARQWLRGTGTAEDLARKWEFSYGTLPMYGPVGPYPAIAPDGTIYMNRIGCPQGGLCPGQNTVYAIKPDGQKKWEYSPDPLPQILLLSYQAVAPDGTVYVVSGGFGWFPSDWGVYLFAIGPNGNKKWAYGPFGLQSFGTIPPPAIGADGTIYMIVPSYPDLLSDAVLHAINPMNGTAKWTLKLAMPSNLPPVVGEDGRIYVVTGTKTGEKLYVITPDGKVQQTKEIPEISFPRHLIMGKGRLYVSAGIYDGSVYSYSLGDKNTAPALKWVKPLGASIESSPSTGGTGSSVDTLYVTAGSKLCALDWYTGDIYWEIDLSLGRGGNYTLGSPTVGADGTIYVSDEILYSLAELPPDGEFWAINPNGTIKWLFHTGPALSSPAIAADGTIYVINLDGHLCALKGFSGGLAASAWPMAGHDPQRSGRLMQTAQSGSQILIEITDPDPEAQPTTLLFETILWPGFVDLTIPTKMTDPPPMGYLAVDPPFVRELQTTAVYTGTVETCFDISQLNYFKRENLRVFHFEGDTWVDRTSPTPGGDENRLCATVESFSQFAILQPGAFTGFFPPVANLPKMNQVIAGQAVPVKFSLGGDQGYGIFTTGYPASQQIHCTSGAALGAMIGTLPAGSSGLSYDAAMDQYVYAWKTDKAWIGTCRQLIVRLNDGSDHRANFKFK
jgi:outer membrane protein assembly factor BamB